MTRKQRAQLSLSLFLILVGGVFVWQYWYNTSDQKTPGNQTLQEVFSGSDVEEEGTDEDEGEETLDADDPLNIPETEAEAKNTSAYVVDQETCSTECARYQNDASALAYCQAVCGLAPVEGGKREAPSDCNDKTETAKDICWRDKAVAEKKSDWCNEILDKNLRQSCHNRIAEEYFDE